MDPMLPPSALPAPTTPLPVEWFEFTEAPRPAGGYVPDEPGGTPATWAVELDGRSVPFKVLRGAPSGAPRPLLVLLHGMGVTVATFYGLAPYLLATHDLVLLDYNSFSVPHGWPVGGVAMPLLAAAVWTVADALGAGVVSLAGASLGGGLAIMAAQQRPPAVERIVLFNPAIYPQRLPRLYHLARTPLLGELLMALIAPQRLVDGVAWVGYSTPDKMPACLRRIYTQNIATYANRLRLMHDMRHLPGSSREMREHRGRLGAVRQPVMVIWGVQDRLLEPDVVLRLPRDLPQVRIVEYADLAHAPHEEAPDIIGPVVAEFLRAGLSNRHRNKIL